MLNSFVLVLFAVNWCTCVVVFVAVTAGSGGGGDVIVIITLKRCCQNGDGVHHLCCSHVYFSLNCGNKGSCLFSSIIRIETVASPLISLARDHRDGGVV